MTVKGLIFLLTLFLILRNCASHQFADLNWFHYISKSSSRYSLNKKLNLFKYHTYLNQKKNCLSLNIVAKYEKIILWHNYIKLYWGAISARACIYMMCMLVCTEQLCMHIFALKHLLLVWTIHTLQTHVIVCCKNTRFELSMNY